MHLSRLPSFFIMVLVVLSLCACRTSKIYYRVSVLQDPRMQDRLTPSGDAVTFEQEGVWGAVRPVGYEGLAQPSALNRGWNFSNPFDGIYAEPNMPIVFYLLIENRSGSKITFNPSASFSLIFRGAPLFSIDYDDLYQDLYGSPDGEARLKKIKKMLFRSYITLRPGKRTRGLLLFRRPDAESIKDKEILLRLRGIYTGKGEIDFTLPFRIDMEKVKIPTP